VPQESIITRFRGCQPSISESDFFPLSPFCTVSLSSLSQLAVIINFPVFNLSNMSLFLSHSFSISLSLFFFISTLEGMRGKLSLLLLSYWVLSSTFPRAHTFGHINFFFTVEHKLFYKWIPYRHPTITVYFLIYIPSKAPVFNRQNFKYMCLMQAS